MSAGLAIGLSGLICGFYGLVLGFILGWLAYSFRLWVFGKGGPK